MNPAGNPWNRGRGGPSQGPSRGGPPQGPARGGPPQGPSRGGPRGGNNNGSSRGGHGDGGSYQGRGRGRGGPSRAEKMLLKYDCVNTRQNQASKKGKGGIAVNLVTNYFQVSRKDDWSVWNYRVDFTPDEERTSIKKKLLRIHANTLGPYVFDGSNMYMNNRIAGDELTLHSEREVDRQVIQISIRKVGELLPTDPLCVQFYNIIFRKCMGCLDMQEINRLFYDPKRTIKIPEYKLELWPGVKTSLRPHENALLLNVDITHKVLRTDSVLDYIRYIESTARGNRRDAVASKLINSIVMTRYNNKTYRIDDIDWNKTPRVTFDWRGQQTSYVEYFQTKYGETIRNMDQPLLTSRPTRRNIHGGQTDSICLIPELCVMTGLTDEMRANRSLMTSLGTHLHVEPTKRALAVKEFMERLRTTPESVEEMNRWGLGINNALVQLQGRQLDRPKIKFQGNFVQADDNGDWTNAFRIPTNKKMHKSMELKRWVIIVPDREARNLDLLLRPMIKDAGALGFPISEPLDRIVINNLSVPGYAKAVSSIIQKYDGKLQMVFIILHRQATDIYSEVKRICSLDYGIPSQCFLAKHFNKGDRIRSIATKVTIQVNSKLGGEPWCFEDLRVDKGMMIVGFDVHHAGRGSKNPSVGAMVCTTNGNFSRFFSCINYHGQREELSNHMANNIQKCCKAYARVNGALPGNIIFYRDGVGEGQLEYVYNTELAQIKMALASIYKENEQDKPRFTSIVVTKRINTRYFKPQGNQLSNPKPGTLVDDVITLPERYDFYLVSTASRQGTVSPSNYNVIFDTSGRAPSLIQNLTYQLCHGYYNWSGTVNVPAVCQYAHKFAYLAGTSFQGREIHPSLSHLLHYL